MGDYRADFLHRDGRARDVDSGVAAVGCDGDACGVQRQVRKTLSSSMATHAYTPKCCPDDELCPCCSAAPAALRLLLEAAASVPESGKSGIEYDLVMLGFEWMQTLFEVRQTIFFRCLRCLPHRCVSKIAGDR